MGTVVKLVRKFVCGAKGREFESRWYPKTKKPDWDIGTR